LVSRGWDVALGKPRLKLRVLRRASQAAFAVIVNTGVDDLLNIVLFKDFVDHHSSAEKDRNADETADKTTTLPAVSPLATLVSIRTIDVVADESAGTADAKVKVAPPYLNR
jgi:hypothetical protein